MVLLLFYYPLMSTDLTCPACEDEMREFTNGELTYEVCTGCEGMWFDFGELKEGILLESAPNMKEKTIASTLLVLQKLSGIYPMVRNQCSGSLLLPFVLRLFCSTSIQARSGLRCYHLFVH